MNATPVGTPTRLPTWFIPHGGGPCFFMDPPPSAPQTWDRMAAYLRGLAATLPQPPRAILVISGHWETAQPTVTSAAHPALLFDYHGFPEHTYRLQYPAPGAPALASQVRALLAAAGIDSSADAARGFDHGVFIPFLLISPQAQIPIVQLSLQVGLDPAKHLAIGAALSSLRDEGVLIVGSGMSFHNLRSFFDESAATVAVAKAFDDWLVDAVCDADPARRAQKLLDWSRAPGARQAHPREEHLLPLMVAAGAAGDDRAQHTYSDRVFGKALSGFRFG